MYMNKKIISVAIAGCFGALAGQANAAVTLGTPLVYAAENETNGLITGTAAGTAGDISILLNSIPGLVPTTAAPMFVKVALLNGATWGAVAPTLFCRGSGSINQTIASAVGNITVGGTPGTNTVTFSVATGSDAAGATAVLLTNSGCIVSAATIQMTGHTTKTVSAQIEYTNGLTTAITAQVGTYISFARGISTVVSAPATNVLVDATSGSDNWAAANNLTVGTAYIGTIRYGNLGTPLLNSAGAATTDAGTVMSAAGGSITVSGPAIVAALSIGSSGVYLVSANAGACNSPSVAAVFSTSAASSVTFSGVTPTQLSAAIDICARVPGNVVITTGQLTATLAGRGVVNADNVLDTSAASNNIANVGSNGSTRNAYFVNASTSTNKTSVLRLINRSGQSGAVTATAYNEAGTIIGTANSSLGTLINNQMLSKTSAELETALGITGLATTAKYSVVFSAALPNLEILNFTKDNATGNLTLSNTSTTNTQ